MGSVMDGEDVVQDTLARAFVALDELRGTPRRSVRGCSGSPTTARWTCAQPRRSARRSRSKPPTMSPTNRP